jgi:hypothetical protein
MKHLLDKRHLLFLYNAYVKSNIEYACGLFGLASDSTLNPIFLLQKRAVRIICKAGYLDNTAHLFRQERILPISKLIKFNSMKLMYDYEHALLPSLFIFPKFTWRKTNQIHNVNLRNANNFYIEHVRFSYLKSHPLFSFPLTWNSLSNDVKNAETRNIFARKLLDELISEIMW